jgi:hypothetical protein
MQLHIHEMRPAQLEAASADLAAIIREVAPGRPEAAAVITDALQLVALELLVHAVGDREVAMRLFARRGH